jgi:hypothetical protein
LKPPRYRSVFLFLPLDFLPFYCAERAYLLTYKATLAEIKVKACHFAVFQHYCGIRASGEAQHTLFAFIFQENWLVASPVAGFEVSGIARVENVTSVGNISPRNKFYTFTCVH